MRKFLRDAAEAFAIAAAVVVVSNPDALIAAGSLEQVEVAGVALLRAALVAGFAAVAPRFRALQG